MRENSLPLWALESQEPVKNFDMIAFTIGYEMAYSNILNMLRLAGIPLHAAERKELKNIVFAGGVCAFNPEPLADFVDFFSLGEGEDSTVEIVSLYDQAKAEGWSKEQFLLAVSKIPGVYVPSFYRQEYNDDGTLRAVIPLNDAPEIVTKRIVEDLDHAFFPTEMIVPSTEIVHDRGNLAASGAVGSVRRAFPAVRCAKKARRCFTARQSNCWKNPATTKLPCPACPPPITGG